MTDILKTTRGIKVLTTSRVGLKVRGEHLFPVTGMGAPTVPSTPEVTLADVDQYDAVQLFATAARRVQPAFELTDDNLADAVRICHLVGGMPLGVLMAAAWVETLTLAEIGDEIAQSLDFLEADESDVPDRQRSMRAVFDHSWGLLAEREREIFQTLSVFRGGFTRQAAERVAGATLRELKVLVDRSLLHMTPARRYEMHELLRQYAGEKLSESPKAVEAVGDRHCAYYISALDRFDVDRKGPRQVAAFAYMAREIDNLRAAWGFAVERSQAERLGRAVSGLHWLYVSCGRNRDLQAACEAAVRQLEKVHSLDGLRVLARVLGVQGIVSYDLGRRDDGRQLVQRGRALLDELALADIDTRTERAFILWAMHFLALMDGDGILAKRFAEQSLELCEEVGDGWWTAFALQCLGYSALARRDLDEARQWLEASLASSQAIGDRWGIASAYHGFGWVALARGSLDEAVELWSQKAIPVFWELHDLPKLCDAHMELSRSLISSGEFPRARQVLEQGLAVFGHIEYEAVAQSWAILGLAEMFEGHYDRARAQGEMALAVGRKTAYPQVIANSLRMLACVELAEAEQQHSAAISPGECDGDEVRKRYVESLRLAQESVTVLRELNWQPLLAEVLPVLGLAERGLGRPDQARQHLYESLQISSEIGVFQWLVLPLSAIAALLTDAGHRERAVEIYALASRYPYVANSRWFEDVFGRHIDAVAATLPSDVGAAARERGRARDLQATVKELLAELEGWQIPGVIHGD